MTDATVIEGNSGTTNAVFKIRLTTPQPVQVSVDYATADGSATAGRDYLATNGTLIFEPGETNKSVTIPVLGDLLDETNETFFLRLSNPTNISLNVTQAIGTIIDDDTALTITQQPGNQSARPGSNAVFSVSAISTFPPIAYQWQFNGRDISGATNSTLNLPDIQVADLGGYRAIISDSQTSVPSETAQLIFFLRPTVIQQLKSQTAAVGETTTFKMTVTNRATLPVNYQWRKDGITVTNMWLNQMKGSFNVAKREPD
jgi:hypothetical protein